MSQYNYNNEPYHDGVLGMKWGKRKAIRDTKRSETLSRKYGLKVGEGVKKREVKGALNAAKNQKSLTKSQVIEKYSDDTVSYFADMSKYGGKKMTERQYNNITKKANDALEQIDSLAVSEIKVRKENGKRYVEAILG